MSETELEIDGHASQNMHFEKNPEAPGGYALMPPVDELPPEVSQMVSGVNEMKLPPYFPPADMIAHPPHYTSNPAGIECIDVVEHLNFNVGNAIKYLWRADLKGSPIDDLKKAKWYIEREIARRARG